MIDKIMMTCAILVLVSGSIIYAYDYKDLNQEFASVVLVIFGLGIAGFLSTALASVWFD